jgi:prepilin-type N-terminal cleavage/methylation domain-containing protein
MKGFTLIELLVVIAILAVLATAIVLVLNPAELIRQARDSTRISDLAALNSAVSLFLTDQGGTGWPPVTTTTCTNGTTAPGPIIAACATPAAANLQLITGAGWVNLNFSAITGGTPIGKLPVDPTNTSTSTTYVWRASTTVGAYEIDAKMESSKYGASGTNDVGGKDGGNNASWYEIGTYLTEI